ncbi:MAG: DUF86 domain-containing protein [Candidatus Sigynarchaeota archaeon]
MDERRILSKLREIEAYLQEMEELRPSSFEDYQKSLQSRRAVEREFQILIESVIDTCYMLTSELRIGPPADDEHMLDLLAAKLPVVEKVKGMKGFRNILVHKYGVIDDIKVYSFLEENMGDFAEFLQSIRDFLDSHKKRKK